MRELPYARLMELIPVLSLLPSEKNVLLDLFAGTGFLSRFLAPMFSKTILIDEVDYLLDSFRRPMISINGDALDPGVLSDFRHKVDMAVCFAGFHHVLAKQGKDLDKITTRGLRISALAEWRTTLKKNGRLLVVDVPAPGICEQIRPVPVSTMAAAVRPDIPKGYLAPANNILKALDIENPFCETGSSTGLETCRNGLDQSVADYDKTASEPADFFESFVSRHSMVGHDAYFQSVNELTECFQQAGFTNINSFIAKTPWFFDNRLQALWFVNELFAISEVSCKSPAQLSEEDKTTLSSAVDRHLGFRNLPGGGCAINWQLMYVWGTE